VDGAAAHHLRPVGLTSMVKPGAKAAEPAPPPKPKLPTVSLKLIEPNDPIEPPPPSTDKPFTEQYLEAHKKYVAAVGS